MKTYVLRTFVGATISFAWTTVSIFAIPTTEDESPPSCGSLLTNDGNDLTLGPYTASSPDDFQCNTGTGEWFAHSYYNPNYMYAFQLTQKCEYQFRTPEGKLEWQNLRDVNSWFEQAAKTFQRPNNVGYKASDDDIVFSGLKVPNEVVTENIEECPEDFCVKITDDSIVYQSHGSKYYNNTERNLTDNDAELLYAFSSQDAHETFYKMMRNAINSSNSHHIFLTNHFVRCGCESFCMDNQDTPSDVNVQATCYVEELCGQRVFQVAYSEDYPPQQKASWASTGTTQVMEWFNECASAMYGCTEHKDSDRSAFEGTNDNSHYHGFSRVFQYDNWKGADNVYGLGGDKYDGFPDSSTVDEPIVVWTCPTTSHQAELNKFGEYVAAAEFFRDAGLETTVPVQQNPCAPEIFNPPDPLQLPPPIGPSCHEVDHVGYCHEMPGATCYATRAVETCAEVDLVMVNETSRYVYGDVAEWADACFASGTNCFKDARRAQDHGTLLYTGLPQALPFYIDNDSYEWYFMLSNLKNNDADTVHGSIYYNCDTWENAYGAQNFTNSAGNLYSVFGNTYGDLWTIQEGDCTPSPTNAPTESAFPSGLPSVSPTIALSEMPTVVLESSSAPSTGSPSARPTVVSTESPTTSPTNRPSTQPIPSPIPDVAPFNGLPDCFDGPIMAQKYSSSVNMCDYNPDMVQINDVNTTEVTLTINNIWGQSDIPEQLRVFVHTNGVNSILSGQDSNGFQCLNTEGSDIDFEGVNEFTVECYQESPGDPWLAVIDVVITDKVIGATNDAPHPCFTDQDPISESCSWRIIVPCSYDALCLEQPTSASPTSSFTGSPTTLSPTSGSTAIPTTNISSPTASPTSSINFVPTTAPTIATTASPTATPVTNSTLVPTVSPTITFASNPTAIPTVASMENPTVSPTTAFATNPSATPTIIAISDRTVSPMETPTSDPATTESPNVSPTAAPGTRESYGNVKGLIFSNRIGPMECPEDILLMHHNGTTAYPDDTVQIVSQDGDSVTIKLAQTFTDSSSSIDSLYYQYRHDEFDKTCFEEQNVYGEDSLEITIQCTVHSKIAMLGLWVADDITKNVLSEGDKAGIPDCCHSSTPEGTPVTYYYIQVKCVSACPDIIE